LNDPRVRLFETPSPELPNIEVGWGSTKGHNSFDAGKQAASAALSHIPHNALSAVFVFASVHYELDLLLTGVKAITGKAPLIGGTTAGEICNGLGSRGVVVGVIASPYISVRTAIGPNVSDDWRRAVRDAISGTEVGGYFIPEDRRSFKELLAQGKSLFGMLFSPGNTHTTDSRSYEILEVLKGLSGDKIPFFGGSTADDWEMERNYVFCGERAYRDGLVVAIFETQLQFGISMGHGFHPMSGRAEATKVSDHEVVELDGERASGVFGLLQGLRSTELEGKHPTFETARPVGMYRGFGRYAISVASYFTREGAVRLSQPVEEGESLAIMEPDEVAIELAARDSALRAMDRAEIRDPAVAFVCSCALQSRILPGVAEKQIDRLVEAVSGVPVVGFRSFGEAGVADDGICRHSSASVSVLIVDHQLSHGAQVALENERLRRNLEVRIRAQRKAEEELEGQVSFMKTLLDTMPNPVWHKNQQGLVTWCNKAFEEYFEVPRERFIGQCHDLFLNGECTGYCRQDADLLVGGGSMSYEWAIRSPSGAIRHALINKVALTEADDGSVCGIVGVIADITAQKAAEKEIEKIEERWNLALMGSGDGVWDWDLSTNSVYLSPRWKEIIGYRDDEVGDSLDEWEKRVHPDDLPHVREVLDRHIAGELAAYATEHRMLCKDGTYRWVLDRGKVTSRNEVGVPLRIVGTHTDVTEQRKVRDTSDRLAMEFKTLLDTLPGFAFYKNNKGEYITASKTFCSAIGFPREEIAGKNDFDCFPPDLAKKYRKDDALIFEGKTELLEIEEEVTWEGGRIPVSTRKVPVKDGTGDVVGLIGLGFDISRQKATAREVGKFQRAMEYSPVSILITNSDDLIEYVNPKLLEVTGYTAEELAGRDPGILLAEGLGGKALSAIREVIMAGKVWQGEVSSRKKSGELFWEMASVSPVLDESGQMTGFVGIKEDITERKRVEESLRLAKAELEVLNGQLHQSIDVAKQLAVDAQAASVAKSQFLANMSHELRTPMNGILGMVAFLLDSPLNDEQGEFAQIIQSSARSLLAIINDILDISKVEAGKITLDSQEFNPMKVVEEAISAVAIMAKSKGNTVTSTIPDRLPKRLMGDPVRLRQILTNLLGNAVKFTQNGLITVEVHVEEGDKERRKLKFSVSDTGIGVPADKAERLFKPFSQVDSSVSRRYGGTGLGLMIAKQLTIMMGGEIGVDSIEGKGSTFWFTASFIGGTMEGRKKPVSLRHSLKVLPSPRPSLPRGLRILVAEDHPMNQKVIARVLGNLGCEIDLAGNGREAVEMLGKRLYDAVLMDLQMPEMDGLQATSLIRRGERRTNGHVPIIAMTAHAMEGDRDLCLQSGMDDYVSKPLEVSLVVEAIKRCCLPESKLSIDRDLINAIPATIAITEAPVFRAEPAEELRRTGEIFDRARLLKTIGGDEDFLKELVEMFVGEMPNHMKTLREMADSGDIEGLVMLVHRLKGASANVRAERLKGLFADIEVAARRQDIEGTHALLFEIAPVFEEFKSVYDNGDMGKIES
jgi:PAS domain S-box-containing protein